MVNEIITSAENTIILKDLFAEFDQVHSGRIYTLENFDNDKQIIQKSKGSSLSRFYKPINELNVLVSKTSK